MIQFQLLLNYGFNTYNFILAYCHPSQILNDSIPLSSQLIKLNRRFLWEVQNKKKQL